MPHIADKPRCTHREQHPIRECSRCGAWLRSFSDSELCWPCENGKRPPVIETTAEAFEEIAQIEDFRIRRRAFQALAEVGEAA